MSGQVCLLVGTTCLPANLIVRKESEGGDEHVQRRRGGHGLTLTDGAEGNGPL